MAFMGQATDLVTWWPVAALAVRLRAAAVTACLASAVASRRRVLLSAGQGLGRAVAASRHKDIE